MRRLVRRGAEDVKLSPKEYDILEQLVIHAGKVLTHKHLLREVWRDESVDPQYLRVYVRQLRQKIEADPSTPRHVLTEPGDRLPAGVALGARHSSGAIFLWCSQRRATQGEGYFACGVARAPAKPPALRHAGVPCGPASPPSPRRA